MSTIYHQALDKFGPENQAWMSVEEIGEMLTEVGKLLTAINHFRRGRIGVEPLAKEIADCQIMLGQLETLTSEIAQENLVQKFKQQKIERLERRIRGEE